MWPKNMPSRIAAGLGAQFLPSVVALIASGVDGLVIATGTGTHPELIRAGVDAGIPVFCEKPVAMNVAESLPVLEHIRGQTMVWCRSATNVASMPDTSRPSAPTKPENSGGSTRCAP